MRVKHLATSTQGGAGIAAGRISAALVLYGVDSEVITRFGGRDSSLTTMDPFRRILSRTVTQVQQKIVQSGAELVTPISIDVLANPNLSLIEADVIHVHAYYNFLSERSISRLSSLNKPIFITLHDQRFFTGGCHYSLQCSNYVESCANCPQVRTPFRGLVNHHFKLQANAVNDHHQLHIISPSEWLASLARKSSILRGRPISVVHNPVPSSFRETNRESLREDLDLDSNRIAIAFSSIELFNPYKGLKTLIEAINSISTRDLDRFHFFFLGGGQQLGLREGVKYTIKRIPGDQEMVRILSAMDFLIVPSSQDNSPSVIGESLMCGTQVIGAQVGGIPELLEPFGTQLFSSGDSSGLAQIITSLESKYDRLKISNKAQQIFGELEIAGQMNQLYLEALSSP